jgi:hypothetical protein
LQKLDADYVLVIFGGLSGYSSDDINKFLWMVRIGGGVFPDHVKEKDYLTSQVRDRELKMQEALNGTPLHANPVKIALSRSQC